MEFVNQRTAYGNTLVELGKTNDKIVVLDADLAASTMGILFEREFPERHFEMGIAEANMTSVGAGLALAGFIPFVGSFAAFASGRAYDQIRQTVSIGKLNIRICGSSAGLSDFGDGATHQSVEDIALMRAVPNMTVISPADARETVKAIRAMVDYQGPCYLRLNRNDMPNVTPVDGEFVIGEPVVLRDGSDVVVFATGIMVSKALEAAEFLAGKLSVKVVNIHTIKPLDREKICALARGCKGVVTAEEHSVIGGLGSAIAEALRMERLPIEFVGICDVFGCSAHEYGELLACYGLTSASIADAAKKVAE